MDVAATTIEYIVQKNCRIVEFHGVLVHLLHSPHFLFFFFRNLSSLFDQFREKPFLPYI